MSWFSNRLFAALMLALFAMAPAIASGETKFSGALIFMSQKATYIKNAQGWFDERFSHGVFQLNGTHGSEKFNLGTQTDTELPDAAAGEYLRMQLIKEGDVVMLHVQEKVADLETPADYKMEVEFVVGTWEDHEAGNVVAFKPTAKGRAVETQVRREVLAHALKLLLSDAAQIDPANMDLKVDARTTVAPYGMYWKVGDAINMSDDGYKTVFTGSYTVKQ